MQLAWSSGPFGQLIALTRPVSVTGDVRVDAPLVGRQAENAVRELMTVVLRKEDELLRTRLA